MAITTTTISIDLPTDAVTLAAKSLPRDNGQTDKVALKQYLVDTIKDRVSAEKINALTAQAALDAKALNDQVV
jgi:hypothetical protein